MKLKNHRHLFVLANLFMLLFTSCSIDIENQEQARGILDGKFAFISNANGKKIISTMDADGNNAKEILGIADLGFSNNSSVELFWSPDGKNLALQVSEFCTDDNGSCKSAVYVIVENTRQAKQVTSSGEFSSFKAWSPNSKEIIYIMYEDYKEYKTDDAFVVNVSNLENRKLTTTPQSAVANPKWSPDGKNIALLIETDGHYLPYIIGSSGTAPQLLTSDLENMIDPWGYSIQQFGMYWSPDSRYLSFNDGPEKISQRRSFIFDTRNGNLSYLKKQKGFLILGWLNENTVLARGKKVGDIVTIDTTGKITKITNKGAVSMVSNSLDCSLSPSKEFIVLWRGQNNNEPFIFDIHNKVEDFTFLFPDNVISICWSSTH